MVEANKKRVTWGEYFSSMGRKLIFWRKAENPKPKKAASEFDRIVEKLRLLDLVSFATAITLYSTITLLLVILLTSYIVRMLKKTNDQRKELVCRERRLFSVIFCVLTLKILACAIFVFFAYVLNGQSILRESGKVTDYFFVIAVATEIIAVFIPKSMLHRIEREAGMESKSFLEMLSNSSIALLIPAFTIFKLTKAEELASIAYFNAIFILFSIYDPIIAWSTVNSIVCYSRDEKRAKAAEIGQ